MVCRFFLGRRAALLTMHGKEQAILPPLEKVFGDSVVVQNQFNTDIFGTFSREILRPGTQREAAVMKAEKAIELSGLEIGISSEGSFVSHPAIPLLPWNMEMVLLIDKKEQLIISGEHGTAATNYAQRTVSNLAEAESFAKQALFPEHWVIVRPECDSHSAIQKNISSWQGLADAVKSAQAKSNSGLVFIETDMRAHANPTRMAAIAKAAESLAQKLLSCCPSCGVPGFSVINMERGLPCEWCDIPTEEVKAYIYGCQKCGYTQMFPVEIAKARAGRCSQCNP